MDTQSFDTAHVKHIIEAALLTASEPLPFGSRRGPEALSDDLPSTARNSSFSHFSSMPRTLGVSRFRPLIFSPT